MEEYIKENIMNNINQSVEVSNFNNSNISYYSDSYFDS